MIITIIPNLYICDISIKIFVLIYNSALYLRQQFFIHSYDSVSLKYLIILLRSAKDICVGNCWVIELFRKEVHTREIDDCNI